MPRFHTTGCSTRSCPVRRPGAWADSVDSMETVTHGVEHNGRSTQA